MKQLGLNGKPLRVLAISSRGGHWVELLRLAPAWDDCEVHYATTLREAQAEVVAIAWERGQPEPAFHHFLEANRWQPARLLVQIVQILYLLLWLRPHVVISTGAAAGCFALMIGSRLGARTVWVDSLANAEELSLSGSKAGRHAQLWLTQWAHLARPGGPGFQGSVL